MMTPDRLAVELTRRLDGPHADEHTTGTAHLAAEAVRFLNYATGSHSGEGLSWPSTVYTVTADLSLAAGRMPQLFGQLTRWLDAELAAGHLGVDDGSDPAVPVGEATAGLAEAVALADRLARVLAAVQSALGSVNGRGGAR
jgi:hypothetical protein